MTQDEFGVRTWLNAALVSAGFREHGFESIHLDELVNDYAEADAVEIAFRALDDLVRCYRDRADELMASLVVVLGYDDRISLQSPLPGDVPAAWDHFTPPELYLQTRMPDLSPYIVEEYKKPFPVATFAAPYGVYHGYYRCHRQETTVEFTRAVYVEHYLMA